MAELLELSDQTAAVAVRALGLASHQPVLAKVLVAMSGMTLCQSAIRIQFAIKVA